ncbi:ABC-type proline/glycine betaine transport systems, permease component [Enterococcus faecalis]|nr:ABC-type proline/glycine betaine transport systems, permease component [Enterococcus faecalis]
MSSFFQEYGSEMISKSIEHIYISFFALLLGVAIAVPVGVWLTRLPKVANIVIGLTSALQTVPSLALLALMIPIFWCRQNTRYYRAIHLFPSTYFKKHVYRNEKCR